MLLLLLSHLSYPTLCDPVDCTLPGSSVPVIFPAKILEWVGMLSSRGSSQPRDWTPCLQHLLHCRWTLYHWATREAQKKFKRVTNWKVWTLFRSQLKPQTYIYIYTHIYVCMYRHSCVFDNMKELLLGFFVWWWFVMMFKKKSLSWRY